MRRPLIAVLAVAAIAAAWWLWPTETRRVRARLTALADAVSVPAGETDLARVARLAALARLLAPDVTLEGPNGATVIRGRETVVGIATRLGSTGGATTIELTDIAVALDASATSASATATVRARDTKPTAIEGVTGETVRIDLARISGDWLVTRGAIERTLKRPEVR